MHEHVEKPQMGFSAKLLQSAARTSCAPMAHKTHTCGLRSIFCQVHAPAENDLTLFADYRRQTLRGFFDRLKHPQCRSTADAYYGVDNGTRTHDLQSHNLTP